MSKSHRGTRPKNSLDTPDQRKGSTPSLGPQPCYDSDPHQSVTPHGLFSLAWSWLLMWPTYGLSGHFPIHLFDPWSIVCLLFHLDPGSVPFCLQPGMGSPPPPPLAPIHNSSFSAAGFLPYLIHTDPDYISINSLLKSGALYHSSMHRERHIYRVLCDARDNTRNPDWNKRSCVDLS